MAEPIGVSPGGDGVMPTAGASQPVAVDPVDESAAATEGSGVPTVDGPAAGAEPAAETEPPAKTEAPSDAVEAKKPAAPVPSADENEPES